MRTLAVLFDETCAFCVACAAWLSRQPAYVPMECLPAGEPATLARFAGLHRTSGKQELVVIDDQGGVYRNAEAWLMTLWALRDFRPWAFRLASPELMPLARDIFELASRSRYWLSRWLATTDDDALRRTIERSANGYRTAACEPTGECAVPVAVTACERCGRARRGPMCAVCAASALGKHVS